MKHIRFFIIALILVLIGGQAIAQTDRSQQPKPGPAPDASFPEFFESQLDNGLKVLVVTNTAQPVVTFRLLIKSGSEYDGDKSGVAGFATDLLTAGTTSRSSLQFAQEADFLGFSIGASAADDQMSVSGAGLKKHMDKLLSLMTDALYHPSFPESELDKLKKQTLSGLKTVKKNPDAIMSRLEITVGYNVHPYSNFQTEEEVDAIGVADLADFHKKYFIPNNASLAVVGDVTPDEILPILKKYFGDWKKGSAPTNNFSKPKSITGRTVHLVDLGKTQSQTAIAVNTTCVDRRNPDYITLSMMNSIIGGGFSGRLFANLREKNGFTYGAYSSVEARKSAGLWNASSSVRRSATDSAFAEIIVEMKRMQNETVEASELDMHKQYASGRFLLGLESPSTVATMVQNIDLYDLPKDYYRNYVKNLMQVTPADIQRMAKKYLNTDNVALLAVGDASVITEPLKQFGEIKMYDTDMKAVTEAASFDVDIDARELLKKHISALGGRDKLTSLKSRITEADLTITFGMAKAEGTMKEIAMAPNKKYQNVTFAIDMGGQAQVIETEKWVDGEHVIVREPMQPVKALTGEQLEISLEEEQYNAVLRMDELGHTSTVTAKKKMDDRIVYVVKVKKKYSTDELFIDAETYLLHAKAETADTEQGQIITMVRYGDYRQVDGLTLPFSYKAENPNMTMDATVTSYKHNTDIPDSTFVKDVK
jgi:predicted Zn-dependent peptidase